MRRGCLPLHLDPAIFVTGQPQAAVHLPARRLAGFFLKPVVEVDRITQKLGDIGVSPELPDQPGGVERGAAGQLGAFDQHHLPPEFGQMIGGRAADDAATDDDGLRGIRKIAHRPLMRL